MSKDTIINSNEVESIEISLNAKEATIKDEKNMDGSKSKVAKIAFTSDDYKENSKPLRGVESIIDTHRRKYLNEAVDSATEAFVKLKKKDKTIRKLEASVSLGGKARAKITITPAPETAKDAGMHRISCRVGSGMVPTDKELAAKKQELTKLLSEV